MTSRRPMTRSFSGNGRSSSFSEEEGNSSNGRSESRNPYLSDVRPENRSTLCSVMAQLSEDIQPSFETTLKSKSVSENCNVKFTCVVSGYPAPELKWYKDDMQMDRYCGLPKYEIHRNGKTHTLHIYNCTLDDAAIYQASASNSKGIVSCSGVLEVGIMDEYKIHQRFFAKLKQKAEKKKKSMEDQKDKENKQGEKPVSTPERPPRKRHVPLPQDRLAVKQPEAAEQLGATAEPNGIGPELIESGLDKEIPPPEEALANKKIKISNGLDADINSSSSSKSHMMVNGNENCYDGGMSLAQFLAETIQSKAAEDKPQELDAHVLNVSARNGREQDTMQNEKGEEEKVQEQEREKRREVDLSISREEESPLDVAHATAHNKHGSEVKHHSKAHKDDHHNIQASISSMLHTVKDFFFGKSKRDSCERELDTTQPPVSGTPPSFRLQPQHNTGVCEPMETDKPSIQSSGSVAVEERSATLELHEHKQDDSDLQVARPSAHAPPSDSQERAGQRVKEAGDAVDAMEVSQEETGRSSSPSEESGIQGLNEEDKDSLVVTVIKEVPVNRQEPDCLSSPHPNQKRDESAPRENISSFPQTKAAYEEECPPTPTLISLEESWTPPEIIISDSHSLKEAPTMQDEEMKVDKVGKEEPDTESKLCEEEKAEVKSSKQPCSFINPPDMTDLTTSTLEGRTDPCESNAPHQVLSPLHAGPERQNAKEETKCTLLVQEVHVGVPPTAASENLEMGDLKIKNEHTVSVVEESTDTNSTGAVPTSTFSQCEKSNHFGEVFNFALEENIKAEEEAVAEDEGKDVIDERSQLAVESGQNVELDKPKVLSVTQKEGNNTNALENCSNDIYLDGSEEGLGWSLDQVPQIHISTTDDTPDIIPTATHETQNERFIIPTIEVMEPEYKECSVPLSILALNKPESEPAIEQKHDDVTRMSEIRIQDPGPAQPLGTLPTQRSVQNDYNLSLTEKVTEVSQLCDETGKLEHQKGCEQLPQTDCSSIPVINVSCTDDKEAPVQESSTPHPTETPSVPVFEVLPISATCQEIETLLVTQRGTKTDVGTDDTVKPEKSYSTNQTLLEMEERSRSKITSSPGDEALTPKVRENKPLFSKSPEDSAVETSVKPPIKTESVVSLDDLLKNKVSVERLTCKPPAHPSLSPGSLRKFMSRAAADPDGDKADEDLSGGSTPTSSLSCESSPRLKRRDSLTLIRSATPEELASGARRKIFMPKAKEDGEGAALGGLDTPGKKETPYMSPSQARRAALLQAPPGQNTPPMERRSPLLGRRKATLEVPKVMEETPKEEPASTKREEKKPDPLKAPQVIRKIRGEPFPDASGHLKLWCQFFNVLSDSTIKWYRDEEEILELKRCGGDESQVALAIVLATSPDCGVYGCTIKNEYGMDSTDFLLSEDVLSEILLKDDLEVGEEIEMTPMVFAKGLGDCGSWGDKYFGRIMTQAVHIGAGCAHKASRVKVIYGLDPVFESGSSCIMKVQNPIAYGTKQDNTLAERSLQITKQECKVQNMIREYCKIFAAEARVSENFGFSLEVISQYLMYRPANSVPYASVEADMEGVFSTYCTMDPKGKLITHTASEVEQKCSTFQHWIHQWTHGNLLVTRLEGVETKLTNVRVVTKSKGYQGLTESGSPEIFEQFLTHHQCNYYCGLLGLRPLKTMESLQQPTKMKGSRSPLLNRKLGSGSPQTSRKPNCSPKAGRKVQEKEDNKSDTKPKSTETVDAMEAR
ncbi:uncharacterized protein alpk3a [Betta splendens]|uniref:non-specific serine/threonine protein kinase n=1 Tax=Betta splendens TaxID=158456 RepID=A0A8M1HF51_BETSP|nr:uncharacterized protein alpk3a [Betta splendens]XP_055365514.1 uncharacterized protein alpk3a [Betta splendens]XP_055365515.1 uncharacterized protein alpk3a [Betta splendens]